jgi:hypothetical protein
MNVPNDNFQENVETIQTELINGEHEVKISAYKNLVLIIKLLPQVLVELSLSASPTIVAQFGRSPNRECYSR